MYNQMILFRSKIYKPMEFGKSKRKPKRHKRSGGKFALGFCASGLRALLGIR